MKLDDLKPAAGSVKRRKVIGRGVGSGHGKTSTRGHKGDKSRGQSKLGFEGGQTPLHRRLPKKRGFRPPFKKYYAVVNLKALEGFDAGTVITPELLLQKRVINGMRDGVKVLGDGVLTKSLTVRAHFFSESAREKIVALGGTAETL